MATLTILNGARTSGLDILETVNMSSMALTALIDEVLAREKWSAREVARRAENRGHRLGPTEITNYRQDGMKTLVPAKILALAAGLDVQPYRVALAALVDNGITVPIDVRTPEAAIEHDPALPSAVRRVLLAALRDARI